MVNNRGCNAAIRGTGRTRLPYSNAAKNGVMLVVANLGNDARGSVYGVELVQRVMEDHLGSVVHRRRTCL